jgi:hypothetical protein
MRFSLENVEWIDSSANVSEGYYHGDVLVEGQYAGSIRCYNESHRVQIYPGKLRILAQQHAVSLSPESLIPFANYLGLELNSESLLAAFFHSLYIVCDLRRALQRYLVYETSRRGLMFVPLEGNNALSILSNPKKRKRLGVIQIINEMPFEDALRRFQTFYCEGR